MSEQANNATEQAPGEDLSNALSAGETEFVATEEKKPVVSQGMLYVLLLLAVGGGGTYFMYKRQGPATAAASTASAETAKAQQTIDTFLTSGPSGLKMMEEMLRNTEKVVKQFLDYPSVTQVPLSALQTNPFRFSGGKEDSATPDPDLAKRKREEERAAALKASQALNVQSIMHSGNRRACMINNTLYQEGQQVEDFTIEKISPNSVIVKRGVFRFELKMQK